MFLVIIIILIALFILCFALGKIISIIISYYTGAGQNTNSEKGNVVIKKTNPFIGLLSFCLVIGLILIIAGFTYKKTMLDFDGRYATDRISYNDEYGFYMLITYHPEYRTGNSKGFAIVHIPFTALFTERVQANKNGNDFADSEDSLQEYKILATVGDNDIVDSISKMLSSSTVSTKSYSVGNNGQYFIVTAAKMGYE